MIRSPQSKCIRFDALSALGKSLRKDGKKIVTTNGCFDVLHWGHLLSLWEARKWGDVLVCGLNSDASVRLLKGPTRPVHSEDIRALQLASVECVDWVTVFTEVTPEMFLRSLCPHIHVKGADYQGKEVPENAIVKEWGGEVKYAPFCEGFSTSALLRKES